MTFDGFIGASYKTIANNLACDRALNLYVEAAESAPATEKSSRFLLGTPGLAVYGTLPTAPVRGIWTGLASVLPGGGKLDLAFAVAGSHLYAVFQAGTVNTSGTAVTWVSGSLFSASTHYTGLIEAGAKIVIAGTTYTVASVTDSTHLVLTASAGTQTAAASWAYFDCGDVGDDSVHSPCTFQVNGGQLFLTSAGLAWLFDDAGLVQVFFNNGNGTVDTAATAVTWVSGDQFDATLVNTGILIAGVAYVITAYVDATHITLGSSAGTQTAAQYRIYAGSGTVDTSGTAVTWTSGSVFTGIPAGAKFVIGTTIYTVASVTDATHLVLTGSAGTQTGADASFNLPVLASMSSFLDGYFIALPADSKTYNISAFRDGHLWNPLDFAEKEGFPDGIASLLDDHEDLWVFGTETTEVWRDTGNADFPFNRDPGAFIHQGCAAPFTPVNLANGVAWIGGDVRGGPVAWRATGYTPVRVSTHAVETAWASYSTIADAVAFVHILRGHQFWVINFPSGNATWVYDATSGLWHERTWWNGTSHDRHRASFHGSVFGKHIVGDWQNGKLYDYSEAYYSDFGGARVYERTAPHLSNEELWSYYSRFRLAMKAGPTPTLAWSDDLGENFNTARAASTRFVGASQASEWRRLGRSKDRVYRVTITTTTAQVAIAAAYLDVANGGG